MEEKKREFRVISGNSLIGHSVLLGTCSTRMIRSLPSWTALQAVRAQRNYGSAEGETYEESPEEINQRSAKETEILTGNLGDAIIPPHEILADPMQLRILALLQESLVIDGSLDPHQNVHLVLAWMG